MGENYVKKKKKKLTKKKKKLKLKKTVKLFAISVLAFICIACAGIYFFMVRYSFSAHERITVNSEFDINNKKAKFRNKYIKLDHKGNVDTTKIGKYKVTYTSNVKALNHKKKVIYNVVDDKEPTLNLVGENVIYSNYKDEYKDPGYTAVDNYDGDLTDKVKVDDNININRMGEYKVIYTIEDSHGNKAQTLRKVIIKDIEKPKISINRSTNSYLILGSKIDINSYTATDNLDGDLTNKVKVDGEVNPNKVGLYKVIYTVSDNSGNEEILETTINVQKKNTKGIPVLMYHWFYDDTKGEKAGKKNTHNYLAKTKLEEQIKYLVDNNYYFPTYEELERYIDKKIDLPEKSIILTADDGAISFFKIAAEVAKEYKVPFTTFVRTRHDEWKGYTDNQYISFQSHTDMLHRPGCEGKMFGAAMCASSDILNSDIKTSCDKLEKGTGIKVTAFAYPYGHHNDLIIKALKNNGIKVAFTINNGKVKKGANKYLLPRVRISKDITLNQFINKIK